MGEIETKKLVVKGVQRVGTYAFDSCSGLKDVYYDGSKEQWGLIDKDCNKDLTTATLHCAKPCTTEHWWNSGEVAKVPTCAEAGEKIYTCIACGEKKIEPVEVAHVYDEGIITTAPTCTTEGVKTYTCMGCGLTRMESIAKINHTYDEGEVTEKPTCNAKGVKTYTCTGCGLTRTESVEKIAHVYDLGKIITEPTCTTDGERTYTCTSCGVSDIQKIGALGHNYESSIIKPSETASGYTLYICSRYGNKYADNFVDPLPTPIPIPTPTPAVSFVDVHTGEYFAEPVNWAVSKSITNGTSETTFSLGDFCTRTQAVTFLWRAAGQPEPKSAGNPFTDVSAGQYFTRPFSGRWNRVLPTASAPRSLAPATIVPEGRS